MDMERLGEAVSRTSSLNNIMSDNDDETMGSEPEVTPSHATATIPLQSSGTGCSGIKQGTHVSSPSVLSW